MSIHLKEATLFLIKYDLCFDITYPSKVKFKYFKRFFRDKKKFNRINQKKIVNIIMTRAFSFAPAYIVQGNPIASLPFLRDHD